MRKLGPRMREALEFIETHPGSSKADVFRSTGARRCSTGSDPVDRLLQRGLIYDLGPGHRYVLYVWQVQPDAPGARDGHWRPSGHP